MKTLRSLTVSPVVAGASVLASTLLLAGCLAQGPVRGSSPPDVVAAQDIPAFDAGATGAPRPTPDGVTSPEDAGPPPVVEAVLDRQARDQLAALFVNAKSRIDLFEYSFVQSGSAKTLMAYLIGAAARGVTVRVLLDDEPKQNPDAIAALEAGGVSARLDNSQTRLHIKAALIDDKVLMLGSTNLSGSALDFNHEANLIIRDPAVVGYFGSYLANIWLNSAHKPKQPTFQSGGFEAWSRGGFEAVASQAMDGAQSRIDAVIYGINLDPAYPNGPVWNLTHTLFNARARGVTVRVLFERSDWNDGLNALNEAAAAAFREQGILVRYDAADTVTHAKVLLIDDQALVGSNNWSYLGMVLGQEGGIATRDDSVTATLSAWFQEQWSAGTVE